MQDAAKETFKNARKTLRGNFVACKKSFRGKANPNFNDGSCKVFDVCGHNACTYNADGTISRKVIILL